MQSSFPFFRRGCRGWPGARPGPTGRGLRGGCRARPPPGSSRHPLAGPWSPPGPSGSRGAFTPRNPGCSIAAAAAGASPAPRAHPGRERKGARSASLPSNIVLPRQRGSLCRRSKRCGKVMLPKTSSVIQRIVLSVLSRIEIFYLVGKENVEYFLFKTYKIFLIFPAR